MNTPSTRLVRTTSAPQLLSALVCVVIAALAIAMLTISAPTVAHAQDAAASPPKPTATAVAARIVQLTQSSDERARAELATLAERDAPDPWDVVEHLCQQGADDAALAFAAAVDRPALSGLTEYVRQRGTPSGNPGWLARLRKADTLRVDKQPAEALAQLGSVSSDEAASVSLVVRVRIARLRARCLAASGKSGDAAAAYRSSADLAETGGWLLGARRGRQSAAAQSQKANDLDGMADDWREYARLSGALGEPSKQTAALSNVGAIASYRGDYRGALVTLAEASASLEQQRRDAQDAEQTAAVASLAAQVLDNRSVIALWLGRHAEALAFAREARDLRSGSEDHAGLASSENCIAQVQFMLGDDDSAHASATRALRFATQSSDREEQAAANGIIGLVEQRRGQFDAAQASFEAAREIYAERDDLERESLALAELALVAAGRGDVHAAVHQLEAALANLPESTKRPTAVNFHMALGRLLLRRGDTAASLSTFREAREAAARLGLVELESACRRGVAAALLLRGDTAEAAEEAWAAAEIARESAHGLSTTQIAGRRRIASVEALGLLPDASETGSRAAIALGDAALLFRFVESGRAATVLASLAETDTRGLRRRAVSAELLAQETRCREDEAAARHRLSAAMATGKRATARDRRKDLEAARLATRDIVARIQGASRLAAGSLYPRPESLSSLQTALAADQAWVGYRVTAIDAVALVVTKRTARIRRLGDTETLASTCRACADAATNTSDARTTAADETSPDSTPTAEATRRLISALELPETVRRLLVVADEPVSSVPFALVAPAYEVVRVPSASAYLRLLAQADRRGERVLAVGDPVLNADGVSSLPALPAAVGEARAVGDVVLVREHATEAAFRAALQAPERTPAEPEGGPLSESRERWSALHFACHGVIDAKRPWNSALALGPGDGQDGRLTALDVVELDLHADLAVLSACESARGADVRGEGLVGLAPAFLSAGCPRVIVSQWRVDDDATAALMKAFHESWKQGHSVTSSLASAQAAVRAQERWREPKFWAAWQCWGLAE